MRHSRYWAVPAIAVMGALGACGDPSYGPSASLADGQCVALRRDLNALDSRGVPSLIERKAAGGRLSADQEASVERYNSVLNSYLSGSCASDARHKATQGRRVTTGSIKKKNDAGATE